MHPPLIRVAVAAAILWLGTGSRADLPGVSGSEPIFVGAAACGACHGTESPDDAFATWSVSKHSRTYVQLGTGYAELIDPRAEGLVTEGFGGPIRREAMRLGIDTDCLSCHTTAARLPDSRKAGTFHLEDGVQCEACHGPGGNHVAWFRAERISSAEPRPENSRMTVGTIDDCEKACHRKKPAHRPFRASAFDAEKAWKKIAHGEAPP